MSDDDAKHQDDAEGGEHVIEVRLYVRRPTADDAVEVPFGEPIPHPDLIVGEHQLVMELAPDQDTGLALSLKRFHAEPPDNPVGYAAEFVLAMKCGIYPGEATLQWLAKGLEQWLDRPGQRLETCLGLVNSAKGRSGNAQKESHREQVVHHLLQIMANLHFAFGLPLGFEEGGGSYNDQSAAYVASSMSSSPHEWYTGHYTFRSLEQRTLLDYWAANPWVRDGDSEELVRRAFSTKEQRQRWIGQIDRSHWQHIKKLAPYL